MHGWWIYAGTAAVSLLSKHVIQSAAGTSSTRRTSASSSASSARAGARRAARLLVGPMSPWLALALASSSAAGLRSSGGSKLLCARVGFWCTFAVGVAVLAATGHTMAARWHLGPITGAYLWSVL
jgi:hypothetical protein